MRRFFLQEPFIHFIVIGTLIFTLYHFTAKGAYFDSGNEIRITNTAIKQLGDQWQRQTGNEPDKDTLEGLVESLIRQEVLLREAKRLGLDKNDTIVRRRLIQKMDFLSANLSQMQTPGEDTLRRYFDLNREKYRIPEKRSFTHIYFSKETRGESLLDDANVVLKKLQKEAAPVRAPELGDNFILQYDYNDRSQQQLAQVFGDTFARALFETVSNKWQGPILSEYGAHLVRIGLIEKSYIPEFVDIRPAVLDDVERENLRKLKEKSYKAMRDRYQVTIDIQTDNET